MERGSGKPNAGPAATWIAALVAALAGGCLADGGDGGILVLKNVQAGAGCVTSGTDNEVSIGRGSLELLLPNDYLFIAQMRSRVTALDGQEDQRTIITTGAKVDITFPGSTLFSDAELADLKAQGLTRFKSVFSVPIAPNGGLADGGFTLIPKELVEKIAVKAGAGRDFRLQVDAKFTVEGDMSGETVVSQPFVYGVTVGNFLTVSIPIEEGTGREASCPLPSSFGTPRTGYVCNAAQDGVIDCCRGVTGALICPATIAGS